MVQEVRQRFSFAEYVQLDADSGFKHEFLGGVVWAVAGGSPEHAAVAANVVGLLHNALRGRPCRAFTSDLRIRVLASGLGTYPDVSVVCGELELDPEDPKGHTVTNPRVLVEVLSPSTEAYDCDEKLRHYQSIGSLQEVVLIAHDRHHVEVVRRDGDTWTREQADGDDTVRLQSLDCQLPLAEVYRDPLVSP